MQKMEDEQKSYLSLLEFREQMNVATQKMQDGVDERLRRFELKQK